MKRKFITAVAVPAMIGTGLFVNAGVSEAATTYNFRLSQFAMVVADVCVITDVETVCSGKWASGKSEVFQVKANSPRNWHCKANIVGARDATSRDFSRDKIKECALRGNAIGAWFDLVRPDH
jgi:hypothetical protein